MGKNTLKYFALFLLLIFLQLFILNNIELGGYINPYIYVLIILLLPYEIPGWLLLIAGFLFGLVIDIFMGTIGMHSSATLFMAFVRPYALNLLTDRDDSDKKGIPSMSANGFVWFLKYSLMLVFVHHLALFYIEAFTVSNFFIILIRVLLSTLVTSLFIILGQFFSLSKK
jgi:rod shape-determining protein MreD